MHRKRKKIERRVAARGARGPMSQGPQRPETPGQTDIKSAASMALRRLFFSWFWRSCGAYTQACGAP
eukprot:7387548-Prymnesium_polylepis.2